MSSGCETVVAGAVDSNFLLSSGYVPATSSSILMGIKNTSFQCILETFPNRKRPRDHAVEEGLFVGLIFLSIDFLRMPPQRKLPRASPILLIVVPTRDLGKELLTTCLALTNYSQKFRVASLDEHEVASNDSNITKITVGRNYAFMHPP